MARKRDLRSKVASLFELPGDVLMDVPRITLVGDVELAIEGHRGLTEYKTDRLVLKVPSGKVVISGTDLMIATISPEQVLVRGRIRGVQYTD